MDFQKPPAPLFCCHYSFIIILIAHEFTHWPLTPMHVLHSMTGSCHHLNSWCELLNFPRGLNARDLSPASRAHEPHGSLEKCPQLFHWGISFFLTLLHFYERHKLYSTCCQKSCAKRQKQWPWWAADRPRGATHGQKATMASIGQNNTFDVKKDKDETCISSQASWRQRGNDMEINTATSYGGSIILIIFPA